jgi:hypothetical protein
MPAGDPAVFSPWLTWRRAAPEDILAALAAQGELPQLGRLIDFRGDGVDVLLGWAFSELHFAEETASDLERQRHAAHAVGHAKRAVECLFDAYLERDFLYVHLPVRAPFAAKLALLRDRFRKYLLPWRLIAAITPEPREVTDSHVATREAGVVVEAAQAVIAAMRAATNPLLGPAISGTVLTSMSSGANGWDVAVHGLPQRFLWIWRCADNEPRAGVGTASATDTAVITFADLRAFSTAEHLTLLQILDTFPLQRWSSEDLVRKTFVATGLDQPK